VNINIRRFECPYTVKPSTSLATCEEQEQYLQSVPAEKLAVAADARRCVVQQHAEDGIAQ
jgi:hypothetical protein